ncbi:DUF4469 domain-containing protein [Thermophagus xiamenensis]|uniref:DNA-binding domain-containing protein n=1 Tax=Thermophagus xiamenensis TaxID=385682 RepID=A0A1I2C593_9BACT|nr:DUF4469 domain-containing protein [Thermophagus xiamenensis]SFE62983.1 DNA-binding domain-containing protein [Thermophagus xiamenensis]
MADSKNRVIVELYDLAITGRKDDRFGRVVVTRRLNETDLARIAEERGSPLSSNILLTSMDIMRDVAKEQIGYGANVTFGLGTFGLKVNGVFIGDNAGWDSSKHSLSVVVYPSPELRAFVNDIAVEVRGMAPAAMVINAVVNVSTNEENTSLTPGGGANVFGSGIKIVGDGEGVGLSLTNVQTGDVVTIPMNSILVNEPSRVSFIVPADLPSGEYQLTITTQYSPSTLLKEPRSYTLEYVLTVQNNA